MTQTRMWIGAIGAAALLAAGCATPAGPPARASAEPQMIHDFSAVDAYIERALPDLALPGAGLIVWRDGRIVHEKYYGEYGPDTVVPIASASKWLSAAVLMSVVAEGKMSLDAPISAYLPEFTGERGAMTIRQMFSHSSGLVDFPGAWDYSITVQDYAARVAREGVYPAAPGKEVRYSSASMQVVGAAMERVTGKLFNDLFLERIAQPCGMSTTTFRRTTDNRNPLLAGGAWSSARDYARFLEMIVSGGRCGDRTVLPPGILQQMLQDQTRDLPLVAASNDRMGRASRYAIGHWIDVQAADGRPIQSSSPGAFGFRPWIHFDRNLFGVFLMRRANNQAPLRSDAFDPWSLIDRVHATADAATRDAP